MRLTIGEKIALLRKEKNITQTELAEYLFLTPQTVSRWEVGSGAPEITLLPKIATFFDVSIDELFGLTSLERTEDLVSKYSVLRDDRSFQEAMESIDSQLQTIDAFLKNGAGDSAGLERDRDQLCGSIGRGRETLAERKKDLMEHPDEFSLLRYLAVLDDRQDYEAVLAVREAEGPVREIVFPPSGNNLSIWHRLIRAAAETGDTDFVEQYMPAVLEACGEEEEFEFLMWLLDAYRERHQSEKLGAVKQRLRLLLQKAPYNKYIVEDIRKRIEE